MDWKRMWMLVWLQLKHTKFHFVLFFVVMFFLFAANLSSTEFYLEQWQSSTSRDVNFIIFMVFPLVYWWPRVFRLQRLQDDLVRATPFFVMLLQLPSPRRSIIRYRFIYHLVVFIPIQLVALLLFFIFSPTLHQLMTLNEYVVFILIWLSISVLAFWLQLLTDIGTILSFVAIVERVLIALAFAAIYIILFSVIYEDGFVLWTIFMATNYPILAIIFSVLLVAVGTRVLNKRVERKISQFDYF